MLDRLTETYYRFFLERPKSALALLLLILAFFAYQAQNFKLDASADSLVLENDIDLQLYRQVASRYQSRDLMVVTFTPDEDLFSDAVLSRVKELRDELRGVEIVESVVTILDVPLVESSDVPLLEMAENIQTVEKETVDRSRARQELSTSPVYSELVISRDTRTTGLLIYLHEDPEVARLLAARNELIIKRGASSLSEEERKALKRISREYDIAHERQSERRHRGIGELRSIIDRYREYGVVHLGGIPMIADDMITFVKDDLVTFGSGVLIFVVIMLAVIFRQTRWVLLPLLSCLYAGTVMIGMLGLIGWKVTVISSNFLSLMLIVTISMNIHLAVRYRQLLREEPQLDHLGLMRETIRKMVWPCLYTAITTIIGVSSLVFSGIKPVIDFGWMMAVGLAVAFLTSFSLFPAVLALLDKPGVRGREERALALTTRLASLTERHGNAILVSSALLAVLTVYGVSRLTVENSFINYFSRDTEIYQGMKLIDEKLGGTTPLDILLDFDTEEEPFDEDEDLYAEDEFDDLDDIDVASGPEYWFTAYKIDRVKRVHDYLEGLPEVGKVLSLASAVRVAEELNEGEEFDSVELSVLYKKLPQSIKDSMIDPYFSFEHNEARILLRILDSREGLRRKELLERIQSDLGNQLELGDGEVTVSGTLVLYNNMLQSLYTSQIYSLAAVMTGIAVMLMILFRSFRLSVIGIVPNLMGAGLVLAIMGLVGIPLDMMTITIAAITIGIGVDDAIHYIYRFREEFELSGDYVETVHACHASVGKAVFYTSVTVVFGFSILVLSNFFPTIYFGVLTSLAMTVALLATLTLLPRLILLWKPFG